MTKIKRSSKLKILLPVLLILAVLAAGGAYLYADRQASRQQADTSGPTPEEKAEEAEAYADEKEKIINSDPGQAPGQKPPESSIGLTAQQESNNTVTVFTKLPGYSNGSCKLTVTNGSKSTTQEAAIIYQPEYSSCAGFSVPIGPLGKGQWQLTLAVSSNGSTASKSINHEVK